VISDFTFLTSLLFASLLILTLGYTILHLQRISKAKSERQDQTQPKSIQTDLRIIFFNLIAILLTRLSFMILFIIEIDFLSIQGTFLSQRTQFITLQSLYISVYGFILFKLLIHDRLLPDHQNRYVKGILKGSTLFVVFDIITSFIFYAVANFDMILPIQRGLPATAHREDVTLFWPETLLLLIGLFALIVLFLFMQRQKRSALYFTTYSILYSLILFLILILTYKNVTYFFDTKSLLYSGLELFTYQSGFIGWFWILLFYLGAAGQVFGYSLIRLRHKFVNKQIASFYILQLSRLSFISVLGLSLLALLPSILIYAIKL
jgi:hypothetical protein